MKISAIGELNIIERLAAQNLQTTDPRIVSIGDDAAVVPKDDATDFVYTTDLLIEGTHFITEKISPRDLGFKALAVNLSDIAAMGAQPRFCFLSLALPNDLDVEWLDSFATGFFDLAKKHFVTLLGGDTTRSESGICINVLVIGEIEQGKSKLRSMAKTGDLIAVTGFLGESSAGLKLIQKGKMTDSEELDAHLIQAHQHPRPHIQEGQWLTKQESVHAMMDISDGLHLDIQRIMERSQCGARIHLDQLPISSPLKSICEKYQWSYEDLAVSGGEDYCLLFTFSPADQSRLEDDFKANFNRDLFIIGEVSSEAGGLKYQRGHKEVSWRPKSVFKHFT